MTRTAPARQRTGVKGQKLMQAVFRVPLRTPPGERDGSTVSCKPAFHTRKSHTKSRAGCKTCKRRRIKCDENRDGGCFKCQDHGIDCDYNTKQQSHAKGCILLPRNRHRETPLTLSTEATSGVLVKRSPAGLESSIASSLGLGRSLSFNFPLELPDKITPAALTFSHFNTVTYCSMGSDIGQEISRATALDLALVNPFLMHAVHGISADHLCHLLPAAQHPVQHGQSQLAGLYHWQKAIRMFRDELAAGPTQYNMDALVSTVMLICVHQFKMEADKPDPGTSFIYASADTRLEALRWLQIHHGFTALRCALGDVLWGSVWNPVFQDSEVKQLSSNILTAGAGDATHDLFLELCDITPESSPSNNVYHEALQFLLFLRRLKPDMKSFNKIVTFVGVIEGDFLRLLCERDSRALVILAYWLALMSCVRQWWIGPRCRSECVAITTFLMHDPDERVRELLSFPAKTVGIILAQRAE